MTTDLLTRLLKEAGLDYISDLRSSMNYNKIYLSSESIVPDEYSVEQWEEAILYILGDKIFFQNQRDAFQFLRYRLHTIS